MWVSKGVSESQTESLYSQTEPLSSQIFGTIMLKNYTGIICQGLNCVEGSDILNVPVNVDDKYWVAGLTVYWKLDLKCLSDLLLPTLTTMVYVYSASACLSLETSVSCWVQPHRIEVFPFYLLHGLSLQIPFSYILPTFEILATWKVIWYLLWHHMKSCL